MKLNLASLIVALGSIGIFPSFGDDLPSSTGDSAPKEEWISEVIPVKYARATDIAAALNNLTTGYLGLETNLLRFNSNAENVLSNAWKNLSPAFKKLNSLHEVHYESKTSGWDRIIADERTNSLLLHGTKADLKVLREAISELDVPREQILIEAVLFEVTLTGTNGSDTIYLRNLGTESGVAPAFPQNSISNAFSSVNKSADDFDSIVIDLASDKRVKILQRPRIQTSDRVRASLFVGDSMQGLTLDVTARIKPDRKLVMSIAQTIERFAGTTNIVNVGKVPITNRQQCQTEVTIGDRQTVLLAGAVENTQNKPSRGVPVLKNVPLIGGLFRNHPHAIRTENVLAIRATILPQNEASADTPRRSL